MKKRQEPQDEAQEEDFMKKDEKDKGLKISETLLYKILVKSAYRLINKPLAVFRLIKQVIAHIERYDSVKELTQEVRSHIGTFTRLSRSYVKGEYREISVKGIALTVAALLYFVAPIDFIPDFLIVGLIDDIAILMWVYHNYKKEIEDFLEWEDQQKTRIEIGEAPLEIKKDN